MGRGRAFRTSVRKANALNKGKLEAFASERLLTAPADRLSQLARTSGLKSTIARAGMALAASVMAVLIPQQALASDLCQYTFSPEAAEYEWVTRVKINETTIGVPVNTDYHDASGSSAATLSAGSSYPVEVDVGTHSSGEKFVTIWLDLNQDDELSYPDELVYYGSKIVSILETFDGTISIPSAANTGEIYGRVIMNIQYNDKPCTGYDFGSSVDFKVTVESSPNSDGPDAETRALSNEQVKATQQLTDVQITNFRNRLKHLHSESARHGSPLGISVNTPIGGLNGSDLLGYASMLQSAAEAKTAQNSAAGQAQALAAHDESGLDSTGAQDGEAISEPVDYSRPFAIWSDGTLTLGSRSDGALDLDYTAVGISFGADYRFTDDLIAGLGFGYGRQVSDIGSNGTKNKTFAYTAAAYASYEMTDDFFIDGLLGAGALDFDTKRYVAAGDFATGDRTGSQIFGSLTATYEFKNDATRIAPYGGIEFARSWLNEYEETGSSANYRYSDQTVDSFSGVVGIQIEQVLRQEWGDMTPGIRFECAHDFADASQSRFGDAGGASYTDTIETDPDMVDALSLGLSLKNSFHGGLAIDLDYEFTYGGSGNLDHTFGAHVAQSF